MVYDDYFETVHASPDKEPEAWPELITFQSFRSDIEEDDENYSEDVNEVIKKHFKTFDNWSVINAGDFEELEIKNENNKVD